MKEVLISVLGQQTSDETGEDSVELVTKGSYAWSEDCISFEYMESELTGLEETKTSFLIKGDRVTLTREGSANAQMIFEEGRKHFFAYETPYGAIAMGVDTQRIYSALDAAGGQLEIRYAVDMNNIMISKNVCRIDIKEA